MSNLSEALRVEYPHDIDRLRVEIRLLYRFSDVEVEKLYKWFSRDRCANWVNIGPETIKEFKDWLES